MPSCALAGKSECLKRRMCLQAQPTDSPNIIVMTMMIISVTMMIVSVTIGHRCDFGPDRQHRDGVGHNLQKSSCLCLVQF